MPPTTQMSYQKELTHLKSFIPKLMALGGNPNTHEREVRIHFPDVNVQKYPNLQKALELYCWPWNPKTQRWVDDPVVEGGPDDGKLKGRWRLVRAECDKSKYPGLVLILREGYARTLNWDEAMLSSEDWLQEAEKYADIIFPNIDPEYLQGIVNAIPTHIETNFTIRTHEYTSTAADPWEFLRIKPEQQDDGSYALRLFAAHPQFTETLYDNYGTPEQTAKIYCHNVPKRLAASVVTTYNIVEGASGSANYSTEQGTVDLIFYQRSTNHLTIRNVKTYDGCEYDEYSDYWYNYTRAEAEAFDLNAVYGAFTQGYEYAVESLSYSGGGRWTIKTTKKHVKSKIHCVMAGYDLDYDSITTITTLSGQGALPSLSYGIGFVEFMRATVDRFCTWSVSKFRRTSTPWEETYTVQTDNGPITYIEKGNQTSIDFGTPATGYCHQLSAFRRNPDKTYNWTIAVVPYIWGSDQIEYSRPFKRYDTFSVKITTGINAGKWQDYYRVDEWVEKRKRFNTEAAAYAYLESPTNIQYSGIDGNRIGQFEAWKQYVTAEGDPTKDGTPYDP